MDKYGLQPQPSGHFTGYDININAGIANGIASAVMWFIASLMPKTMSIFNEVGLIMYLIPIILTLSKLLLVIQFFSNNHN